MSEPKLIVYKGPSSQTGIAVQEEFPNIDSQWKNESFWKNKTFDNIKDMLSSETILAVLPMWNSHKGEIRFSHVLEMLFEQQVKLYTLWSGLIIFECISRLERGTDDIKKIISVVVAEEQCSNFLDKLHAEFLGRGSTLDAYEEFCRDSNIDAALCAPGQNKNGFNVLCSNAANPTNFTVFVLLGCLGSANWSDNEWGSFYKNLNPKIRVYFGVQMPIQSVAFSDDQQALFSELTGEAETIDDIPKILFVTRRTPDKCGILIEASDVVLPDNILTEEGYSTELEVIQDIGTTHSVYTEKIYEFFCRELPSVVGPDFIRHKSNKNDTCFFACPSLGIIMHGFEDEVVEPVARLLIYKYFELIDAGIGCSNTQRDFFEKHKESYYEHGMDFIKFVDI